MLEVNVREARQSLSRLLDQVEAGHEVQITRHGKVVARLIPETSPLNTAQVLEETALLRQQIQASFGLKDNAVLRDREEARY